MHVVTYNGVDFQVTESHEGDIIRVANHKGQRLLIAEKDHAVQQVLIDKYVLDAEGEPIDSESVDAPRDLFYQSTGDIVAWLLGSLFA